eukprot:6453633-Karenia_brevis.AAC.1
MAPGDSLALSGSISWSGFGNGTRKLPWNSLGPLLGLGPENGCRKPLWGSPQPFSGLNSEMAPGGFSGVL